MNFVRTLTINLKEFFLKVFISNHERTKKITKNVILTSINKGLSLFLSFLFLPIFFNSFEPVHYGIFITIFSFVNWIYFFDLGVGHGLRNKLAVAIAKNEFLEAKKYVSTAYIIIFLLFTSISMVNSYWCFIRIFVLELVPR